MENLEKRDPRCFDLCHDHPTKHQNHIAFLCHSTRWRSSWHTLAIQSSRNPGPKFEQSPVQWETTSIRIMTYLDVHQRIDLLDADPREVADLHLILEERWDQMGGRYKWATAWEIPAGRISDSLLGILRDIRELQIRLCIGVASILPDCMSLLPCEKPRDDQKW